ncbi:protein translocase subunit SecD [Cellulomonas rhizosphaerae]|uniref:Protein translocase subunit SecD n=1 Tax=Cellulomonas rhizosphaerae TaxID=2293719 RepID=A0A413RM38_9CELL|nr:protein translocase subunit SecD [Cellulomonas rhizosphaerae]RHA41645.1 protein translocase subunit SecD [Cellulomonas rhizosphaerae]
MAPPTRRNRPVRTLITLGIIILAIFGAIFAGTKWSDATWTPKLALDLEGGTQIVLKPVSATTPTSGQINQAIDVIRQRVDASGVSEAEITSQGSGSGTTIVVGLPGKPSEDTLKLVRTSAQMEFRPVLVQGAPTPTATDDATDGATPAPTASATAGAQPTAGATPSATPAPSAEPTPASTEPSKAAPDSASDTAYYITPAVQQEYDKLDCTDPANLRGGVNGDPKTAFVTCESQTVGDQVVGVAKYILGPVEIDGNHISSASSGLETLPSGGVGTEWIVTLKFDSTGAKQFTDVTERLATQSPPLNQFGIVLDGLVVSAPAVSAVIPNGQATISGSFTRQTAATLAQQLNFGALPMSFEVQSEEQISATLGADQLQKGLLAGLIGLALVVLYSLLQYRALGLVTVASLIVAAVVTYGIITLMSWTQGYRLSLPGVAGLIVAIGITADSFIVYFERIRDELREGRTLGVAVERGWSRAKRTILASDAVNFLAAIVLYILAVGGVRGFAFTLGLTTLVDVLVVFMFTHPVMELLARTKFFSEGHRASGLDPRRLGVIGSTRYVGRGKVATGPRPEAADDVTPDVVEEEAETRVPAPVPSAPRAEITPETAGMTIAERRAAQKAAAAKAATTDADDASGRTDGSEH